MMKKIFMFLFCALFNVNVFAASKVYVNTEQNIIFTAENLAATIPEFVQDEAKQNKMVETYQKLMNPENGAVSVENLLAVCRDGGINTYRQAGFDQCRAFVQKLLENAEQEFDESAFQGFCPGLDEKGNNPNKLSSITDKTRVGDFCSSTNIAGGDVVFKEGYYCTCAAYACNDGYESKGGACVTKIADAKGYCLRKEYTTTENLSKEGATLKFCESKAAGTCKVFNGIKNFGGVKGKVVCNATKDEFNKVRAQNTACETMGYPESNENNTPEKCASFCRAKAKENGCKPIQSVMKFSTHQCVCNPDDDSLSDLNMYKEVCGKDKGKTGKTEYCIKDFFNWTNTQPGQALGFAQDYAKMKNGHTVFCSNKTRKEGNDDYVKCATKDKSVFYEFKFDDIRESIDADRRITERSAICRLAGGSEGDFSRCKGISSDSVCTTKVKPLAQRYGHDVEWRNGSCEFTLDHSINGGRMSDEEFEKSLAKIDGLDNRAFFKAEMIAIRKNFVLLDEIKKYVKSNIPNAKSITCNPGYDTVHHGGWFAGQFTSDDVKRCFVDGKPIDFVFQDLSEIMGYERTTGEDGAKCVSNSGKFDGHYCRGLTESECYELEEKLLAELNRKGWAGDKDLVDWDEKAGACELNSAQFSNNVNKVGKYTAIAGLTVGGVFTGGTSTAVAVGLMATELAGMAGEIYTERKKELLPQQWADEFLTASRKCSGASCAETTLKSNFGKISQASDMLNKDVLKQVDDELARLAEYLPDERFEEILGSADAPSCWETWECQERIFMVMQMASLATAVGKGLVNFSRVIAKKAGKAAAETSTAIVKVSSNADDAIDLYKGVDGAADASRAASTGAKAAEKAGDTIYDAAYFAAHPSAVDDVFKGADNVVQVAREDIPVSELRKLMKNASANGFTCAECGGDILKFTKNADKAADASKVASGAGRAAETATDASRATSTGAKAADGAADVVLDENELVRVIGNDGKVVNKDYIQASKDAREFMNKAIESEKYTKSVDDYIETMNKMHEVSAKGASGKLNWYADAGQGSIPVNPGKIRDFSLSNGRFKEAAEVEQIAKKYGDPFRVSKSSTVDLPGIPKNNLPKVSYDEAAYPGQFRHIYPEGKNAGLRPYYEQMYRTSKEATELISKQASEKAILEKIAEHYQYAANARPYGQINNSLFMNEVNTLLQKAGLRTMPHGNLDHAAMYLQPDAFKKYFIDTYYKTRL